MKSSSTAKSDLKNEALKMFNEVAKEVDTEVGRLDCEMEVYFQALAEAFIDFYIELLNPAVIKRDGESNLILAKMLNALRKCIDIARYG